MGIRVHKVVGYGLTDLKHKRDRKRFSKEMIDPRFDWERLRGMWDLMYETGGDDFMLWAERNWADLLRLEAEERRVPLAKVEQFSSICPFLLKDFFKRHGNWSLADCVIHQNEFGLPNVLVLVPPMQAHSGVSGWKRYDDTIDWIEESSLRQARNRVVRLPCCGIYPYDGTMVRFRSPKPGLWKAPPPAPDSEFKVDSDGHPTAMLAGTYNMLVGRWDPGKLEPLAQGELLRHLLDDWRPQLPSELLALLWWMRESIKDFDAVRDGLRPLLYVYWS